MLRLDEVKQKLYDALKQAFANDPDIEVTAETGEQNHHAFPTFIEVRNDRSKQLLIVGISLEDVQ